MAFKRFLLKTHSLGNLWFYILFKTCLSDIRACVHIVSLKVIVGIRGLIEENTRMDKPEFDSVSAGWAT